MNLATLTAIVAQLVPLMGTILRIQGSGLDANDSRVLAIVGEASELLADIQDKLATLEADGEVTAEEIADIRSRQHALVDQWNNIAA